MKNKNIIITLILLLIYIIINNYNIGHSFIKYNNILAPIILLLISIITSFLLPKTERRIKYKYEKFQNIIIILIVYFIIYFLSGLFFGYEYSIYKQNFISIIKNVYILILPIIFSEYIRNKLVVNTNDNIYTNLIISIFLLLINLNIVNFINNLTPFSTGFKYTCTILLPLAVTNFVMTKISRIAGRKNSIIYSTFLKLMPILLPIVPSLPWIITGIIGITLPMIIYFNMTNFELLHSSRERRYSITNKKTEVLFYIISFLTILFIFKVFKYYPVSILSNSMKDTFSKGDTVVIEKVDYNNIKDIKEYDIIYYKKNNKFIVHRVVEIKKQEDKKIYITKGDNNDNKDSWEVYEEDIVGIVKFSIPYIGYPSVWLNETLNK